MAGPQANTCLISGVVKSFERGEKKTQIVITSDTKRGEYTDHAEVTLMLFGRMHEMVAAGLKDGMKVFAEGRLTWQDRAPYVVVSDIQRM